MATKWAFNPRFKRDPAMERASRMIGKRECRALERAADALLVEAGVATGREGRRVAQRIDRQVRLDARRIMAERRADEKRAEAAQIAAKCANGTGLVPREPVGLCVSAPSDVL